MPIAKFKNFVKIKINLKKVNL